MTKPFDLTKPLQTRDGREVRIYATDAGGEYPIHGAVKEGQGWLHEGWSIRGELVRGLERCLDLVNVPQKNVRYLNIYPAEMDVIRTHATKELADSVAAIGRIACVRVEFEEGQFDE